MAIIAGIDFIDIKSKRIVRDVSNISTMESNGAQHFFKQTENRPIVRNNKI